MTPLSEAIGYWLIDFYALATVVLLATLAIFRKLKQPARRLPAAWSALSGLAALAVMTALPIWPRISWPRLSERPGTIRSATGLSRAPGTQPTAPISAEGPQLLPQRPAYPDSIEPESQERSATNRLATRSQGETGPIRVSLDRPVVLGWAFYSGAIVMLAWLAMGHIQTVIVRRRSVRAPHWTRDFLARAVGDGSPLPDLRLSDRLAQPVAVGLIRPSIILPSHLTKQPPESRLDAVLAHEWAHIRNRDLWLIALSRLLMPILFAHPAYWWLRGRIRDDQEILADAAASTDGRVDYARVLLSWAQAASDRPGLAVAGSLALWERPSQLKRRIVMLLDRDFRVELTCPQWWRFTVRSAMALTVLSLSVMSFRPAPALAEPANAPAPQEATQKSPAKTGEKSAGGEMIRVFDSQGKPAAGVKFYRSDTVFRSLFQDPGTAVLLGQSDKGGSFLLSPPDVKAAREGTAQIVAIADGAGPAFVDPSAGDSTKVLRLADDDVPIRGRVLDINGQGVAGASIQLVGIHWHPSGKLDGWLAALAAEKVAYPVTYRLLRSWNSTDLPSLYPPVVTDREGRFTLKGVGRERVASLLISGPKIETRFEYVATRPMPAVKVPDFDRQNQSHTVTYHGAPFDLVAGPCLEVVGTVIDKDTGKPIAGAVVQTASLFGNPLRFLRTTTDTSGRYRLTGIPPKNSFGQTDDVLASVPDGPPYLQSVQSLDEKLADKPVTRDFALKLGVVARGRVTDKVTGKPIQANLDYFILYDNPHLKEYPKYGTIRAGMPYRSDENGYFKIVVMPGRGILGARFGNDTYRLGVGIANIKGLTEESPGLFSAQPMYIAPMNYNMLVEIDPKPGDRSIAADMQFERGRTVKGTLKGPDGEPVSGTLMMGAEDHFQAWGHQPLPSAEFEVHSLGPDAKRGLLFYHEGKKLAAAYVVKPGENGPLSVRLEPCGTLSGRLTENGVPSAETQMTCDRPYEMNDARYEHGSLPGAIKTDKDGRFQVVGLVPGLKYSLRVWKGNRIVGEAVKNVVVKTGEIKDVGDVKPGE
jgi:beta-lactamase regulating signal transducer with metallopeptidase domain